MSRKSSNRRRKHLVLVDNLGLAFMVAKGRSSNFAQLRVLQQIKALSLASQFSIRLQGIPSELNVADGPSPGQILPGPFVKFVVLKRPLSTSRVVASKTVRIQPPRKESIVRGSKISKGKETSAAGHGLRRARPNRGLPRHQRRGPLGRGSKAFSTEVGKRAQQQKITLLESKSVSDEIVAQYSKYHANFMNFCKGQGVCKIRKDRLDILLADCLDLIFIEGKGLSEGEKTVAAVATVEFFHVEAKGRLLRSRRALKGWRKEWPPQSRVPLPKTVVFGIAMILCALEKKDRALKALLDFDTYMRPGESFDLCQKDVVAPTPGAGQQY